MTVLTLTGATAASAGKIPAPSISYKALTPILIVFGVALLGVLVDAFFTQKVRSAWLPADPGRRSGSSRPSSR